MNKLLIPFILVVILLVGSAGFGYWAYSERQDYKNNVDEKIEQAVAVAVERAETAKDNEFIKREKNPLMTYKAPQAYGSFTLKYPKTWSNYVEDSGKDITLNLHPKFVPSDSSGTFAYALRVQVLDLPYDEVVRDHESEISTGEAKARPFKLAKRPGNIGLRLDGRIDREEHNGSLVILPLRDKTITVATLSDSFKGDFDNIILKHFNFIP